MAGNPWMNRCASVSLTLGALALLACESDPPDAPPPAAPRVDLRRQEIVNGTRDPRAVALAEGQILSLGWLFLAGDPSATFCTATLIGPSTIITAAHCTEGSRPQDMGFGVGLEPTDPTATFRVAAIYQHPQADMAVVSLTENATDRVPALVAIPVNTVDPSALEGTEVQVGGYGETRDRARSGRYFASVRLNRVGREEIVVDGQGLQGVCFGDSGGPVIGELGAGPVVMGVESWGDQSCVDVDHMTRIDVLADFIQPVLDGGAPPDACEGLDYLGRCSGQVAEWCEGGQLQSVDCVGAGGHCDFVDNDTGWYCVDGAPPTSGEDTETPAPDAGATEADTGGGGGAGGELVPRGGEEAPPTGGALGAGGSAPGIDATDAALDDTDAGPKAGTEQESGANTTSCSGVPARGVRAPLALLLLLGVPLRVAARRTSRRRPRPGA